MVFSKMGSKAKKRIKIQGTMAVVGFLALIFLPGTFLDFDRNDWTETLGALLFFGGYIWRILARGYKASAGGNTLVTQGPYALSRNPMYLGTLLISLGMILVIMEWWVMALFLAVYLAIYIPQINREERFLKEKFGVAYLRYAQVTPRFFPSLTKALLALPALSLQWPWVKKELPSLVCTLLFVLGIKFLVIPLPPQPRPQSQHPSVHQLFEKPHPAARSQRTFFVINAPLTTWPHRAGYSPKAAQR